MRRTTHTSEINFLTLTVVDWMDVFTRTEYKDFIIDSLKHCQQNKGLEIFAYVIMTNHLHLIARAKFDKPTLAEILRDFKSYTAKNIIELIRTNEKESRKTWLISRFLHHGRKNPLNKTYQFWKNGSHPIALTEPEMLHQKMNYLHLNPVKAAL